VGLTHRKEIIMGLESTAVRVGGFRNQPGNPNIGEGKNVTYDNRVFKGNVEFDGVTVLDNAEIVSGTANYDTAPTVDGRVTTRDIVVVSPVGGAPVAANTFGEVTTAAVLVADERIIGYTFPTTVSLTVGITFEGFRITGGTDVVFVWQNVTALGVTIPTLSWTLTIGRV
jgi:hypothetical protein